MHARTYIHTHTVDRHITMLRVFGLFVILFHYVNCVSVSLGELNAKKDGSYTCGSNAMSHISCKIYDDIVVESVQWVKYSSNLLSYSILNSETTNQPGGDPYITLTLDKFKGNGLYSCQYNDRSYLGKAFNLTITIQGKQSDCIDNSATITETPIETLTSSITGNQFEGLNPLIYTVVSGLLLGILILVSIITCWIRSRKNARLRSLLPQDTPQDYLDYIQQGEFTPLTTMEFIASLRERPPTYNESEVIQRRLNDDGSPSSNDGNDSSPPPPPSPPTRPMPRPRLVTGEERSEEEQTVPVSPPPSSSPGTQGNREEEEDRNNISDDLLGNINNTNITTTERETTTVQASQPLPNLFDDDFTLSFLLDESSSLQQPLQPVVGNGEDEDDSTTETTNLLVGVIPSIHNAYV